MGGGGGGVMGGGGALPPQASPASPHQNPSPPGCLLRPACHRPLPAHCCAARPGERVPGQVLPAPRASAPHCARLHPHLQPPPPPPPPTPQQRRGCPTRGGATARPCYPPPHLNTGAALVPAPRRCALTHAHSCTRLSPPARTRKTKPTHWALPAAREPGAGQPAGSERASSGAPWGLLLPCSRWRGW